MSEKILSIKDLKIYFPTKVKKKGKIFADRATVKAVNGISFDIFEGETLGIVGESGCGKSTTGRALVHLEKPTSGQVLYRGEDIWNYPKEKVFDYHKVAQMIFQDAYSTLDPRFTIGRSLLEPMRIHKMGTEEEMRARALELMDEVGLPQSYFERYPHEFSGGQKQRIGIARALTLSPRILVCDEPVSALDVSIQAQILNLMMDLQREHGLTYVFVSHNLSVVKYISDRIGVFYLGNIVELAEKNELYNHMLHPYTQALISAVPVPDPKKKGEKQILEGDVPSPLNPPAGCPFVTRCRYATERCRNEKPELKDVGNGHYVACFKAEG